MADFAIFERKLCIFMGFEQTSNTLTELEYEEQHLDEQIDREECPSFPQVPFDMGKKPLYIEVEGLKFPQDFLPEVCRTAMSFRPEKGDVVVATYPKCGTTWATQIAALILRKGEPLMTTKEYFGFIPFLEATPVDQISRMTKPRLIKTHLPFDRINFNPEAKYIYVARHPADCLLSFYHHIRFFPTYFFTDGSLDDFFEIFVKGEVDYNDFFDHLLHGYELRNESNVLFLTYESMKSDHRGACLQIARFMGEGHYKSLMDEGEVMLNKVLEYSSLEFMKSTVNGFWRDLFCTLPSEEEQEVNPVAKQLALVLKEAEEKGEKSQGTFIRKGVVGESKAVLSREQLQILNDRIREKTANSDVMSLWKDY